MLAFALRGTVASIFSYPNPCWMAITAAWVRSETPSFSRMALRGLRQRFPQAGEAELRRKLANLLLGEDLARKAYGETGHAK